jgi:hypothetical protein
MATSNAKKKNWDQGFKKDMDVGNSSESWWPTTPERRRTICPTHEFLVKSNSLITPDKE